ncbi:hypothetical protein SAMN05216327_102246 [Dyadobacter sp. SG02]|uniref:quinol:cytochrome C oxidoreductase n=1 Tax=Dyadobacter sp. SG02 TaxID=1855291 RepID=UPI0008CF4E7B|nr:quinol:cytochrome C oxidoreductase [Dyadobacter sp. SG02]SEI52833.1 hypothetical protein SAMN05216327_102246 [Dyadobacter sp. SG02]
MISSNALPSIEERFIFTRKAKQKLLIALSIGVLLITCGIYIAANSHAPDNHHNVSWITRIWANIWLNAMYLTGISATGMFVVSYDYLSKAGWSVVIKRVAESLPGFLPVTGLVMLGVFLMGGHDLFHWTHHEVYVAGSPAYDKVLAGKQGYLNTPFFLARMVFYFVVWYWMWRKIRQYSLEEDQLGGTALYDRSVRVGTAFVVVFAITSSTSAWDFILSIDAHWFSTMFGWYTLAGWHVSGIAVITLIVVMLRERGYLRVVNASHLRDLGKMLFAWSIFWTYLWFCQYLLIYYSNQPEEVIYFIERFGGHGGVFKAPFFISMVLNFVFPFLILMPRDAKSTHSILKVASWSVIVGHYVEFYTNIMPGTVGGGAGFGPLEIGFSIVFFAAFAWSVSHQLGKANLIPKRHPMLEESLHHDIL